DQHRASVLVDHDVARLQIAIDDRRRLRMEKIEHGEDLPRPSQHPRLGQLSARLLDELVEVPARHELHHQVMASVLGKMIDEGRDAGMREAGENRRLAREVLYRLLLGYSIAKDHLLDRDGTIGKARVVGQIHPAHAAHAEDLPHAVAVVEKMALGKRLTRIHCALSIPGSDSADRAGRRAASQSPAGIQEIGSIVSLRNVLPMMISSPDLSSTGFPGCSLAPRFT